MLAIIYFFYIRISNSIGKDDTVGFDAKFKVTIFIKTCGSRQTSKFSYANGIRHITTP